MNKTEQVIHMNSTHNHSVICFTVGSLAAVAKRGELADLGEEVGLRSDMEPCLCVSHLSSGPLAPPLDIGHKGEVIRCHPLKQHATLQSQCGPGAPQDDTEMAS